MLAGVKLGVEESGLGPWFTQPCGDLCLVSDGLSLSLPTIDSQIKVILALSYR